MTTAPPASLETTDCDFLIVGAGSSGCVLASRLVRQGLKVLLIEAGPADVKKHLRSPREWLEAASSGDALSEAFVTVPQRGMHNRRLYAYRGRGGGGSSNVNATLYFRGSKEDYEKHWPWELKDVEASFKSVERELALEHVTSPGTVGPSCQRIFQQAGYEHVATATPNVPQNDADEGEEVTWTKQGLHMNWTCTTTEGGKKRRTAWTTFVNPVMTMPNLRIKDDALVTRVVIEGGRAVGVELSERSRFGRRVRQLRFSSPVAEILLCGGAFRTPKLLMLSGVGPKEHLEEKGVPVMVDSPQVGSNLQDHLITVTLHVSKQPIPEAHYSENSIHGHAYYSCAAAVPASAAPRDVITDTEVSTATSDNTVSNDGTVAPAAASSASTAATVSKTNDDPVFGYMFWDGAAFQDNLPIAIGALLMKPGILMAIARVIVPVIVWILARLTPLKSFVRRSRGISVLLTTVKSKGTVRLKSADATAPPEIDPAYLTHPDDERVLCESWHRLRRANQDTPEAKAALGQEIVPGAMYKHGIDDESFLRFAKDNALSFFHPVGTCRMGRGLQDSVVASDTLRVHGVSGLRVADASIAPRIPSTPTQAMAMMIGDRAASIVLKDRFTKERVQAAMVEAAGKSIN